MKRLGLVLICAAGVAATGCSWLKNRSQRNENIQPPKPLVELSPTLKVQRVWEESVGKGAHRSGVRVGPTVVDGKVYAASVNGRIASIDAASGKTLWSKSTDFEFAGGPAVEGDVLVAGSLNGEVVAFDAHTGEQRWNVQVSAEVVSAPAVAQGTVIVRSNDGHLTALDAADGKRRWVYDRTPVPLLSLRGNSPPLIDGSVVYDGADSGRVFALRADTGATIWEQRIGAGEGRTEVERLSDVDGPLTLDGGSLYAVGYRGALVALSANLGRPQWSRDLSSYTGVALSASNLYAVDADSNVLAVDRVGGASVWKNDAFLHRWLTTPAAQQDYLVVGDVEGYVHWLSQSDGKEVARERLSKDPIRAQPVVVGDSVFVEDDAGRIAAYRISP